MQAVTYGLIVLSSYQDKSGAYLFMPDGPAKAVITTSPLIRVVKGRILTEVHVFLDKIFHVVRIKNVPGVDGSAVEVLIFSNDDRVCCKRFRMDFQRPSPWYPTIPYTFLFLSATEFRGRLQFDVTGVCMSVRLSRGKLCYFNYGTL